MLYHVVQSRMHMNCKQSDFQISRSNYRLIQLAFCISILNKHDYMYIVDSSFLNLHKNLQFKTNVKTFSNNA